MTIILFFNEDNHIIVCFGVRMLNEGFVKSFLKKHVVKVKLKKLRVSKGLPVSGSKDELIERALKHYGSF